MTVAFTSLLAPDWIARLSKVTEEGIQKAGWRFACEGSEFTAEEIAASDGLLPMWMHRAQDAMSRSLGTPAPLSFRVDGGALCGVRPEASGPSASLATWALFVNFTLEEWVNTHPELARKGEPVPMDTLYQQWRERMRARQLPLLAPVSTAQPVAEAKQAQ